MTSGYGEGKPIFHQSLNPSAPTTILLIHGALSSSEGWNLVAPHLQPKYHLLIPDLPRHSCSSSVTPFTIENTNSLLAHLIQTQAKDGVAHIVGLSLGAHVVANFAAAHPELVLSVFASGMSRHTGDRNTTLFSHGFYGVNALERLVPGRVIKWLLPELDFNELPTTSCTVSLCREIIEFMKVTPERFPKRTLVIAAAKGGFVPTNDNLEAAKFFGQMAKKGSEGEMSRCVKHDGMRHAWSRQDPELFARVVEAWAERAQVLTDEGFESLL